MSFNSRSPAVKRLMKEAEELSTPTELYFAQPLEDNLFEWHFTIRGPSDTDFDGGIYHGRILLPTEYPMKPPSIIMLTHSGRFKVHEKICLSISGHHPETWLPSWSIRTALLALIGFMPTLGEGAIGSLDYTSDERKSLAKKSLAYTCAVCKTNNSGILQSLTEKSNEISAEAKELASQIAFKDTNNAVASDVPQPADEVAQPEIKSRSDEAEPTAVHRRNPIQTERDHEEVNGISNVSNNSSIRVDQVVNNRNVVVDNVVANDSLSTLLYGVFGALFVFLLLRRIYLMIE